MRQKTLTLLLTYPLLASCALLGAGPVEIPRPAADVTLQPGDVLVVRPAKDAATQEPVYVLQVAEDSTVELPGIGALPVDGYTKDDLAAVLLSMQPDLGTVRVEVAPASFVTPGAR